MRCSFGLLFCFGLTVASCSSSSTFECDDFAPRLTADGREVIYGRDICGGPPRCTIDQCSRDVVDSHLLIYDVQTQATSELSLWVAAFDVSSDGEIIAYYPQEQPPELTLLEIYDRGSGDTTRLDVAEFGGYVWPSSPRISGDGQVVAFTSGGFGEADAIFLYDRATEQFERANTLTGASSSGPSLSNDARFLAYQASPDTFTPHNAVYVLDRSNGESTLVSVNSDGEAANAESFEPEISGDGRFVVFRSAATNLVAPSSSPSNFGEGEVYLHDRQTGTTSLVSTVADSGEPSGTSDGVQDISTDGRFVVYNSDADNIVPVEGQASVPGNSIYRYDAQTGDTTRVSINSLGESANGISTYPSVSDDGRLTAFVTDSTNLDPDDAEPPRRGASPDDVYLHDVDSGETRWVSR